MPRSAAPADRRAFGRRETFMHAIARVPGRPGEPCIVRDYSSGGALLEFPVDFEPTGPFRLSIEAKGVDAVCEVRRRDGRTFGIRFLEHGETGAAADGPPDRALTQLPPLASASREAEPAAPVAKPIDLPQVLQLQAPILVVPAADVRRLYTTAV